MVNFGVAEGIIHEDFENFDKMCAEMRSLLLSDLRTLSALSHSHLLEERYERFRKIGIYEENGSIKK